MYTRMYMCTYVHAHVCMYICVYTNIVYMSTCMFMHMCTYVHICVCVHQSLSIPHSSLSILTGQFPSPCFLLFSLREKVLHYNLYLLCSANREIKCSWPINPVLTLCTLHLWFCYDKADCGDTHMLLAKKEAIAFGFRDLLH